MKNPNGLWSAGPLGLFPEAGPQPHSAYKYKVVVSTLNTHSSQSKTLATASLIAKGTGGVWKAKHSRWRPKDADRCCISYTDKNAYFLYGSGVNGCCNC